jgi:hypothetical protein
VRVVLDANVVFAGVGWRGEAHRCLLAMEKPFGIEIVTPRELLIKLC